MKNDGVIVPVLVDTSSLSAQKNKASSCCAGGPPRVSVIVPNYNHAIYLRQRLDSIIKQTFTDIEIIVLDDASIDQSLAIIREYAAQDLRVRVLANTTNSGSAFRQWNRGVREAKGSYVWIAESDDYADVRFLEITVGRLDARPAAGLAFCDTYRVVGETVGNRQSDYYHLHGADHWLKDYDAAGVDEVRNSLYYWNTIPNASAVLFRKEVYNSIGGAPEDMVLCGDWMTWIRMLLVSDVSYVLEPLNYFRCHGGTVRGTASAVRSLIEQYQVLQYVLEKAAITPHCRTRACNRIAAAWVCALFEGAAGSMWPRFRDVYSMARCVDKAPLLRLMQQTLLYVPRKVLSKRASAYE